MASLGAAVSRITVDVQRQRWEIMSFTGSQSKQQHFVEFVIQMKVTTLQPVEEMLLEFTRTRRFSEFDAFRKSLLATYPSLLTQAEFPQKTWFRGGSKHKNTIKQRIFWFREWLNELLDSNRTKGVTNPAVISLMTAHWLYGETPTDKTLQQKKTRANYNPELDIVQLDKTKEEIKQMWMNENKTKRNEYRRLKQEHYDERSVVSTAMMVRANTRQRTFSLQEEEKFQQCSSVLNTGWIVKKWSSRKTLMGNSKVQTRSMWVSQKVKQDNSNKEKKVDNGGSRTMEWTVQWCDVKKRQKEYKKETINRINFDHHRGPMFVSFITPSRQVEFEFDNKEEIKVLMENWYHCNIVYPTYMALIDCIHTYERTNIQFTEQWNKQIEMDVMFKEDDWFLNNSKYTMNPQQDTLQTIPPYETCISTRLVEPQLLLHTKNDMLKQQFKKLFHASSKGVDLLSVLLTALQSQHRSNNTTEIIHCPEFLHYSLTEGGQRQQQTGGTQTNQIEQVWKMTSEQGTDAVAHLKKYALAFVHIAIVYREQVQVAVMNTGGMPPMHEMESAASASAISATSTPRKERTMHVPFVAQPIGSMPSKEVASNTTRGTQSMEDIETEIQRRQYRAIVAQFIIRSLIDPQQQNKKPETQNEALDVGRHLDGGILTELLPNWYKWFQREYPFEWKGETKGNDAASPEYVMQHTYYHYVVRLVMWWNELINLKESKEHEQKNQSFVQQHIDKISRLRDLSRLSKLPLSESDVQLCSKHCAAKEKLHRNKAKRNGSSSSGTTAAATAETKEGEHEGRLPTVDVPVDLA